MSRRLLFLVAVLIGGFVAYRKATADRGGVFDPDRPETH